MADLWTELPYALGRLWYLVTKQDYPLLDQQKFCQTRPRDISIKNSIHSTPVHVTSFIA
jgi:hypothetical protein